MANVSLKKGECYTYFIFHVKKIQKNHKIQNFCVLCEWMNEWKKLRNKYLANQKQTTVYSHASVSDMSWLVAPQWY